VHYGSALPKQENSTAAEEKEDQEIYDEEVHNNW